MCIHKNNEEKTQFTNTWGIWVDPSSGENAPHPLQHPGGGGGATQSMNEGNNSGPSRPSFLGFYCFQNWQKYNHRSIFQLVFPKLLPQEVNQVVKIVPTIVLGSIIGNFFQHLVILFK